MKFYEGKGDNKNIKLLYTKNKKLISHDGVTSPVTSIKNFTDTGYKDWSNKDLVDEHDAWAKETDYNALYKHMNKKSTSALSNQEFSSPRFKTIDVDNHDFRYDSSKQQKSINYTKTADRLWRSKEKNFEGKTTGSNPNHHTICKLNN